MLLEIKDVSASYESAKALKAVSIEVREGSTVTLIGANGAGKTTILRVISGLKRATSGTITFQGQRIDGLEPEDVARLGISHCPEGKKLFPHLTVTENLRMGAYLRKDKEGILADLNDVYQRFPILRARAGQHARTLSGGEQQMAAIARGLMSRPRLLMLDEPSLGLAPLMVRKIADIITQIRNTGVSVILVEQNSIMALELAEYAYVMEIGTVAMEGQAKELMDNEHVKKAYLGL